MILGRNNGDDIGDLAGKTIRIPVLVEEKNITEAVTSATFSGLNGDQDDEYYIISDLVQTLESDLLINFNSDMNNSQNYTDIILYGRSDTHNHGFANKLRLSTNYAGHFGQIYPSLRL
jgi:hypothetical protein